MANNIYAVYALISGHPGGGGGAQTPRTYAGMARDWSILFANFKSDMGGGAGGIGMLLLFRNRIHGGRPAGFVAPPPDGDADGAGNECRSRLRKDWVCW